MVIAIIGLLITAIAVVGTRVMHSQRVKLTETIMKNTTMAIEQFTELNPLRGIYDRRGEATFGKFPPYQLENDGAFGEMEVPGIVEPVSRPNPYQLRQRVYRDLSGGEQTGINNWVGTDYGDQGSGDEDIRALYTYLKVYVPDALASVPDTALKPLKDVPEFVNPTGAGTTAGTTGLMDVLGIHDAWGVPLDYMLYARIELRPDPDVVDDTVYQAVDRIPALRSRGIEREVYDVLKAEDALGTRREEWMFSAELPQPRADKNSAGLRENGVFQYKHSEQSGWVRVKAANEDYGYLPDPNAQ